MAETFEIRIEGLEPLLHKMQAPVLLAPPVRKLLTRSSLQVLALAKEKAPVDTGRLRGSLRYQVSNARLPLWARVGTNLEYAPPVEFGAQPHWPPKGALQPWAERHGFPRGSSGDYLVRRAIARRGTRPRPFLRPAFAESVGRIRQFTREAARDIALIFGKK